MPSDGRGFSRRRESRPASALGTRSGSPPLTFRAGAPTHPVERSDLVADRFAGRSSHSMTMNASPPLSFCVRRSVAMLMSCSASIAGDRGDRTLPVLSYEDDGVEVSGHLDRIAVYFGHRDASGAERRARHGHLTSPRSSVIRTVFGWTASPTSSSRNDSPALAFGDRSASRIRSSSD